MSAAPWTDAAGQHHDGKHLHSRTPVHVLPQTDQREHRVLARSVQCYLLLGTRLFQQSMRNALSPLLVFMAKDFPISTVEKGQLLSGIALGYFFTQVPGGALADRLGAKNVITCSLFLSAVCCLLIPWSCNHFGVPGLWMTMVIMGAVQGPLFPTSTVFLSKWLPKKTPGGSDEKAWGTAMLDIGISVGALLIIPLCNGLAGTLGWRLAFQFVGFITFSFIVVWQHVAAEDPSACRFISETELRFLSDHTTHPSQKRKATPTQGGISSDWALQIFGIPSFVALHSGVWAVFIAHIAFNYGAYYLTNWSPTYYAEVLKVDPAAAKYHLMMPHIANLAVKALNPALLKATEQSGFSLLVTRRIFTIGGFVAAALALMPCSQLRQSNPWMSTALFSVANASFGLAPSGFKSNYLDITEQYIGVLSGYGNTLGTVASWLGPQLVAALLHYFASWDVVLASVCIANFAAAFNYARYSTVTPVEYCDSEKSTV